MAIATEASLHSTRHTSRKLFCRMSAHPVDMKTTALCHRSHWVPKSSRSTCYNCRRSFRLWAGKHHCRLCGEIVCKACSTKRIRFQSKSVRTCDDCVYTNVQNISESVQYETTPTFLRSKSSSAAFESYDTYERRSRQNRTAVRPAKSRVLQSHQSLETSPMTSLGMATTTSKRAETFSSKEMARTKCLLTISSQTQIVSLVLVAFVVLIVCIIERGVQV